MELTTRQEVRFFQKIKFSLKSCWLWTGLLNLDGYGQFGISANNHQSPHRISYEYFVGPIPEGFTVDHLCKNRACVNPAHLEAVTSEENSMRGDGIGALNLSKTHCYKGHRFTRDNTHRIKIKNGNTTRRCLICQHENYLRYKAKKTQLKSA